MGESQGKHPRKDSVPRYLVVYLPAFALERCGYAADDLAGVIAEEKSAMRLQALTPSARRAGLEVFMTATEARALVPEVELILHDPVEEERDRSALIQAFSAISDRVLAPWPETLCMEVSGSAGVFGGEEKQREAALRLADTMGHVARAAVADDPLTARALARWGLGGVVGQGGGREALGGLPLEALEPSPALLGALRAVGVECVESFARLDGAAVAHRFGPEGVELHAVARGAGRGVVLDGSEREGPVRVSTALGGATSLLQLNFVLPGLLGELVMGLAQRGLSAVRLRVVLHLERSGAGVGPATWGIGVTMGRPTRDVPTLERLVRMRMEGTKLSAPVDEMAIEVVESVTEVGWQPGLLDRTEATEPLPDVLARLADHLGEHALCAAEPVERWKPEGAWRAVPWPVGALFGARVVPSVGRARRGQDPVVLQQQHERPELLPRPSILLHRAEPLEVRCSAVGRPEGVRLPTGWVGVGRAEGPERLRSDWWSTESWQRDYWVVRLDERTGWIFVDPQGRWFLHGWFD